MELKKVALTKCFFVFTVFIETVEDYAVMLCRNVRKQEK